MLGLRFAVEPARIAENLLPDELPRDHVRRLAEEKARAVAVGNRDSLVLAGDTVVVLDDAVLGKPENPTDAEDMLRRLSGRAHEVLTALALAVPAGGVASRVTATEVTFRSLRREEIRDYVSTGEPLDKAGAYGIQELGSTLVASIKGDYYSVVGLPVAPLLELLEAAGWRYRFGSLEPA